MKIKGKNNQEYILHSFIGQGQFGKVYSCPPNTKQPYAVKQISFVDGYKRISYQKIKLIRQEVGILKMLNHPNVVKLYDIIQDQNSLYLVMEKCDKDLDDYMKENKNLSQTDAVGLFEQIAQGLHYLHTNKIVHRDLKPANILIRNKKEVKIADFGFAKHFSQEGLLKTVLGTPAFMAPEIFEGQKYSTKCDIWSAGVIFYQLLLHSYPPWLNVSTQEELFQKLKNEKLVLPSTLGNWTKDLLTQMLTFDQHKRIGIEEIMESYKQLKSTKKILTVHLQRTQQKKNAYPFSKLKLLFQVELQLFLKEAQCKGIVYESKAPNQSQLKIIKDILSLYNDEFVEWVKNEYPQIKRLL